MQAIRKSDVVVAILILALLGVGLFDTIRWPAERARIFPLVIGIALLGLVVLLLVRALLVPLVRSGRSTTAPSTPASSEDTPAPIWPELRVLGLLLVFGLASWVLGIPTASVLFGALYPSIIRKEPWWVPIVVVGLIFGFLGGLSNLLRVNFPAGVIDVPIPFI